MAFEKKEVAVGEKEAVDVKKEVADVKKETVDVLENQMQMGLIFFAVAHYRASEVEEPSEAWLTFPL